MTDEDIRAEWRAAGGSMHGPNIETVTMPEEEYFKFRRAIAAAPQEPPIDDLAALVRRLAYALRQATANNPLPTKALDYLKAHGLEGSPLRDAPASPGASEDS
jgi:hypothetical protein